MESIIANMVEAVKIQRKEHPEMSDTEIHQWIDEVMQDAVSMHEVSLKDYQAYQSNPYGFTLEVMKHV
jgi:hypothetical protein